MKKGKDLKLEWDAFLQNESEPAYYALYRHYFHYLNFIGVKKGFPANRVKDAVNDVFLYVWENREKLSHIGQHHNYIVTTFLRKLYRKESFTADLGMELEDLPELFTAQPAEAEQIQQSLHTDATRILEKYVGQLPARQRQMVYQKFYLGLSYHEIATTNDVSVNTVYNTIYNAVEKLRTLISKEQLVVLSLAISLLSILFLIISQNR